MLKLVLASSSPRRRWVLERFGYEFKVVIPAVEEKITRIADCLYFAELKAKSVQEKDAVVLACDTIVVLDGKILGKPKDKEEAREMLKMLSGMWHEVYTGYAIISSETTLKNLVKTRVKFAHLQEEELNTLLNFDNLLDKAGAYGIQGLAGLFIEEIKGSYFNVVGIPIEYIYWELKRLGIMPKWEKALHSRFL